MRFVRAISLFFMCFCLLAGSVASAAAPCCCASEGNTAASVKAAADMDMPCHKKADNDNNKNSKDCKACGCLHSVQMGTLLSPPHSTYVASSGIKIFEIFGINSHDLGNIFQPPKSLS